MSSDLPGTAKGMALIGNCLLLAFTFALLGCRPRFMRNRRGRWHAYWLDHEGRAWEFYARGAAARSYWQNAWYRGRVRRCPTLDRCS